ncbi:protein lin-37 homolog isoform X2 [Ailuropoda melanoleuca]|uniref:protein lin-37 homolog isoform X2 n=1 Tax=Ailuropoda melanoleuca TaxID=9646 RepID=UPI001494542D|nr:protein lin-37 homolog isoform X2 [Ailuropoda melanoleuca]
MAAAVNWSATRSTVALTNGNRQLTKGPAHRRESSGGGGCSGGRRRTLLRAEDSLRTKLILTSSRLPSALICDPGLFWAPPTQLATPQTQTMFPVKVKVEKSELEMAKARNQLDAVLQCLLEKSHMDRERLEEEAGKTPSDTHNKDCSVAATGKRVQRSPTARVVMCTSCLHPQPLGHLEMLADPEFHPPCSLRPRVPLMMSPPSLSPHHPHSSTATCSAGNASVRGEHPRTCLYPYGFFPNCCLFPLLLYPHHRWKEASHRNQLRYSESMKILREMYERQ